jgi:hypothetical protein
VGLLRASIGAPAIRARGRTALLLLALLACGTARTTSSPDGGSHGQDAGEPWTGLDAGQPDAGPDAGSFDAGPDAGPPADGGGAVGLGDPCVPGNPDPCAAHGLVCTGGHCQLPEEMACVTTNDCFDPTAVCATVGGHMSCVPDFCGPGTTNGSFYSSCDNQTIGDGTCLPGVGGGFGLCLIHGTAPLGSRCGDRTTSLQQLCSAGALCAQLEGGLLPLCAPVCDLHEHGGPTCSAGFTCFDGPTLVLLDYNTEVGSGYCLQDCGNGKAPCPSPLQCASFGDQTGTHTECLPAP